MDEKEIEWERERKQASMGELENKSEKNTKFAESKGGKFHSNQYWMREGLSAGWEK